MKSLIVSRAFKYIGSGIFWRKFKVYLLRRFSDIFYGKHSMPIGDDYRLEKANVYDLTRESEYFWKNENDCLENFLQEYADVKTVLDAPFGTGRFISIYNKFSLEVTALDASQDMIDQAKTRYGQDYIVKHEIVSILDNVKAPSSSYDAVICFRFLPWVVSYSDALKALQEIYRLTNKYALIELCVGDHSYGQGPKLFPSKTLWNRLNLEELTNLLNKLGFKVVDSTRVADDFENPGLTVFTCIK